MDKIFKPIENSQKALTKSKGLNIFLIIAIGFGLWTVGFVAQAIPMMFLAIIAGVKAGISGASEIKIDSTALSLLTLFFTILVVVAVIVVAKFIDRMPLATIGLKKDNKAPLRYVLGLGIGFGIFSIAVLFCKVTGALEIGISDDNKKYLIPVFFVAWLFQGFEEEIFCRGWMMCSIAKKYPTLVAVLVNAFFFAVLHSFNSGLTVLAFVNLFLFGVFASVVFLVTEDIWTVAAIHSIWNMVQGNFYGIRVSGNPVTTSVFVSDFVKGKDIINGGNFGLEGGLGVTLVLVVGIAVAYVIYRKKHYKAA